MRLFPMTWVRLAAAAAIAGGQGYTPPPAADVGRVDMVVSCAREAQGAFERGAALLHSFWYDEARKAFEQAADADPDCAMAYWGQAMTWTTPLWDAPSMSDLQRGLEAARRAAAIGGRTPLERGYLDAVLALYEGFPQVSQKTRMVRYRDAMARVHAAHPKDRNAAAFYALSLLGPPARMFSDNAGDRTAALAAAGRDAYDSDLQAAELIERVFGSAPDHPGAAHYLIHAYDNPEYARKGLAAADKYASTAPAVPHALHMPSHIYTRLGLWEKAAASNDAAWKASDRHVAPATTHGGARDYHSLQWLLYAYLQQGRVRAAGETLDLIRQHAAAESASGQDTGARYHLGDMAARFALETRQWRLAMDAPEGGPERHGEGTLWYARGLGAARAAGRGERPELLAGAREAAARLEAIAAREGRTDLADMERIGVLAAIAAAQDERDEMAVLLAHATSLEDRMTIPGQPCYPVIPIHELAGDLWLQVDRYEEAQREFRAALARYPKRAAPLLGLARASARLDDRASAEAAYRDLLEIWRHADADLPALAEARAYVAPPSAPSRR
jgi:tetratricopeptide (TPR) repeat protein